MYSPYGTAYGNFMPNFNNLYGNQNAIQPQQLNRCEITRVNGRNGAEAFMLAPNSSVLLLDETAPIVWLAQSDGAGYKTITPYSITPYQTEPPVNTKDLESRISRLEEIVNGKSDITSTKRSKSANAEQQ